MIKCNYTSIIIIRTLDHEVKLQRDNYDRTQRCLVKYTTIINTQDHKVKVQIIPRSLLHHLRANKHGNSIPKPLRNISHILLALTDMPRVNLSNFTHVILKHKCHTVYESMECRACHNEHTRQYSHMHDRAVCVVSSGILP